MIIKSYQSNTSIQTLPNPRNIDIQTHAPNQNAAESPIHLTQSISPSLPSSTSRLQQLSMLLRVRLLNIPLRHLLHHKVPINDHILRQHGALHPPLSSDGESADGRLGVDEGVDAVGDVGQRQLVGCLLA